MWRLSFWLICIVYLVKFGTRWMPVCKMGSTYGMITLIDFWRYCDWLLGSVWKGWKWEGMEWKWRCKLFSPVWKSNENWGGLKNGLEICVGPIRKFALQMWSENRLKSGKKIYFQNYPSVLFHFFPLFVFSLGPV